MSGIIPPSIVNYDWTVKVNDPSFLNVSFPFRVKIVSMWFTTQALYGDTAGLLGTDAGGVVDIETTDRILSLAAFKSKNSKTQHSIYDNPTDMLAMFQDTNYDWENLSDNLKPTMWLGNPDDAAGRIGAFATQGGIFGQAGSARSTAKIPVDKSHAQNTSWDEGEWNARTYLADAAIMNTDEMLQLFVFASDGDWTGYENDGVVTISVAYTGVHAEDAVSASAKTFLEWWND
jgi:hypothetical protein